MKIMDFDELVAKKLQRDKDKNQVLEINLPNSEKALKMIRPKESEIFNIVDEITDATKAVESMRAMDKLIYICCPVLQDTNLQKEIGVVDPYDTVAAIFDITERQYIGDKLQEFCGFGKIEEDIKN